MDLSNCQHYPVLCCCFWHGLCPNYHGKETSFPYLCTNPFSFKLCPCCSNDILKCSFHALPHVSFLNNLRNGIHQSHVGLSSRSDTSSSATSRKHSPLGLSGYLHVDSSLSGKFHAKEQSLPSLHLLRNLHIHRFRSHSFNSKIIRRSNLQINYRQLQMITINKSYL